MFIEAPPSMDFNPLVFGLLFFRSAKAEFVQLILIAATFIDENNERIGPKISCYK